MSILWLTCDEKGNRTLPDDPNTSVVVYPETFQYVMVPPQLNLPQSTYRVKSSVTLPCPVCRKGCTHYLLVDTYVRVAVCYSHENPYMFYSLAYEED